MKARGRILVLTVAGTAAACAAVYALWLRCPVRRTIGEDLPAEYRTLENPLPDRQAAIADGDRLFHRNCVACHGVNADGKGPASTALTPLPANFRDGSVVPKHSDAYLYWRISEGKHDTAMPRWNGALDERERWAIVAYLRSLEVK